MWFLLPSISGFIALWFDNICKIISIHLNLSMHILLASMWSVLRKVPCALKNVYFLLESILYRYVLIPIAQIFGSILIYLHWLFFLTDQFTCDSEALNPSLLLYWSDLRYLLVFIIWNCVHQHLVHICLWLFMLSIELFM